MIHCIRLLDICVDIEQMNNFICDMGNRCYHFQMAFRILISGGSRISRRAGADLIGGANSQGGYILKNLYVKTKESGPLGRPLDPPMLIIVLLCYVVII